MSKQKYLIVNVNTSSVVAETSSSRPGEVRLKEMIDMLFVNDGPEKSAMTYAKRYRPEFINAVKNGDKLIAVAV